MSTPKLVNFPHGSKFQSVNTKTSQFSPFFGFQEFEKNMSTPKLFNFHHFFGFQELRKKHVNTKASQFSTYFGFQKFEKNMSTPKLGNFPDGSKFQSVNTKTSQFSPFFDLHEFEKNMSTPKVWEKNMSTPKLVNFPHFLTCTSLRKTCQHQKFEKKHVNTKTSPFSPFFDLHEFEKNMSTPKLVNFPSFLTCTSLRKTCQHQN